MITGAKKATLLSTCADQSLSTLMGRRRPVIFHGSDQNADHCVPQNVDEFFSTEVQAAGASRSKVAPKSTGYEGYDYGDYFRIQGGDKEPAMITGGGRARPSHSTWAAPGDATTEAARPSATTSSRYRKPAYTARLHGTRPSGREDGYTSAIDGREAARKYDGSGVNPIPE
ncbi:hypothetical protein OIU84_006624 [Salix udensis]|uniref:Uncharacterized protein n=1 Tax=Salix udensis TaxID=889485 RepID=A0AAD6JZ49_9ROSI|nr:hypothetical protein OIU84_006624 [Salix udensis]